MTAKETIAGIPALGMAWGAGFLMLAVIVGMIWMMAADSREHGRNLIASPEYLECEGELQAVAGFGRHNSVLYCLALHSGRKPAEGKIGDLAALYDGPRSKAEFRERFLTFGLAQVPAANCHFYKDN